jgi:hypothetical protein
MIQALAQRRSIHDRCCFLKFDCWHLASLPLIQQAFPQVPCYFVFRDPVAILWSHHRQRGSQMVPGLRDLGPLHVNRENLAPADLDGYATRVLEAIFMQASTATASGALRPINHHQLLTDPLAVIQRCGIELTAAEQLNISQRSKFHSKRQGDPFHPALEPSIPPTIRQQLEALAAPNLIPAYHQLNATPPL